MYCIVYFYYSDMYKQIQWQCKCVYNIVTSPFGLISHSKMYVVKEKHICWTKQPKINIITQYCKSQQAPGSTQCWGSAGTAPKTWTNTEPTQSGYPPSKHGTPAQRRTNAGPSSTMLAQHRSKHRADVPRPLECVRLTKESYLSLYIVTDMTPIPQIKII